MVHNFTYVFLGVYMLGALWLVVSGVASFFTKHCTIWVGAKIYRLSGKKAIFGGAILIVLGLLLFAWAFHDWRVLNAQEHFQ